jgi:methionyl aminopeptidase
VDILLCRISSLPLADGPSGSINAKGVGGEPRGDHLSRDGDGSLGDGDGDDDADGDHTVGEIEVSLNPHTTSASTKKKRKKSKKKASAGKQSWPPRVPIDQIFPSGQFPSGEILKYESVVENTARTTAEEDRYESRRHTHDEKFLSNYRKAAEIHRQVRKYTQETARPGSTLTDIAVNIEDGVRALLNNQGLEPGSGLISGMGFPTGLSLNNCVAHYTPNPGQKEIVLKSTDVMKVDFGVHINGWIVDSAFTMSWDPTYDNLLAAVKDATNTGIKVIQEPISPSIEPS